MILLYFFFSSRRRHTRYWRDWSSDVCSSDLFDIIEKSKSCNKSGLAERLLLFSIISKSIHMVRWSTSIRWAHYRLKMLERSEERRVGKEWISRWSKYNKIKIDIRIIYNINIS